MKKLYLIAATAFALPFLFSACATYQINTIASTSAVQDEKDGSFIQENDSLKITYSFSGENAPVTIEIYNKLNEPLVVDWQRSALIYGDSAVTYAGNKASITADLNGYGYDIGRRTNISSGQLTGTITLPQYTDFIPPHTFIKRIPLQLTNVFFDNVSDTAFRKVTLPPVPGDDYPARGKRAVFSQANSPLVFTSYLSISGNNADSKRVAYQQQFYIAETIKTGTHPEYTSLGNSQRKDLFFISRQTGYGKTMGVVGPVVAASAIIGAAEAINNNNRSSSKGSTRY